MSSGANKFLNRLAVVFILIVTAALSVSAVGHMRSENAKSDFLKFTREFNRALTANNPIIDHQANLWQRRLNTPNNSPSIPQPQDFRNIALEFKEKRDDLLKVQIPASFTDTRREKAQRAISLGADVIQIRVSTSEIMANASVEFNGETFVSGKIN